MSKTYKALIMIFTSLALAMSGIIIAYILFKGVANISPDLFKLKYTSENVSIIPALISTFFTIDSSSHRNIYGYLPIPIRKKQSFYKGGEIFHRNSFFYSFHSLCFVWIFVLCN